MWTGESNRITTGKVCLLAAAMFFVAVTGVQAQKPQVRIRSLDISSVRTPQFRDTTNPKASPKSEWIQFVLTYDSAGGKDDWLDDVTLDWYVLLNPPGSRPMLLKQQVVYADVDSGTHVAVVYIRPKFAQRYTGKKRPGRNDFAVYVEVRSHGERMDRKAETRMRLPNDWYLRKEPEVSLIQGELLPRTKTPFAAMDYDFYEHISTTSP